MKRIISLICLLALLFLRLEASYTDNFATVNNFINQIDDQKIYNKSKAEILYIFFKDLSTTFDLNIRISSSDSLLKIYENDSVRIYNCNNSDDITTIISSLNIYSNKIDSILKQYNIDLELDYYLCDFLISRIDHNRNSRVISAKYIGKSSSWSYDFEYKINNKNEYVICWLKNIECSKSNSEIKIGDIIQSINSIPARYFTNNLVHSLFFETDSVVDVVLLSDSVMKSERLIPKKIKNDTSYFISRINKKTVLLKINTFLDRGISRKITTELYKGNYKRVIIDLRNNGGGYIDEIARFTSLFLNFNDTVFLIRSNNKRYEYTFLSNQKNFFKNPEILILINNSTSSGANIVAGVLRNKRKAVIIGEKSYGINNVNRSIVIHPKTYYANLLVGKFSLVNDDWSLDNGINPDYFVNDCFNGGIDNIFNFAIIFENIN